MRIKPIILKIALMIEMSFFGYLYMFGKNGLQLLTIQQAELCKLNETVHQLQKEVLNIEDEMNAWEKHDFYKEKVAREQLQMARKDDKLFYIG